MRRTMRGLLGVGLAGGLLLSGALTATAQPAKQPPVGGTTSAPARQSSDALPNPLDEKQQALRKQALDLVLTGQRKIQRINGSEVVKVGRKPADLTPAQQAKVKAGGTVKATMVDQYVELSREQTDRVFVVLTEFGNQRSPQFPDRDTNPAVEGPKTFDGPLHNKIPQPDRSKDNSTIWQANYSPAYFRQLYFGRGEGVESLRSYYEKQSSGRYSVAGLVTDWVKVKYNEARYGRSTDDPKDANGDDPNVCADHVCRNSQALVTDGVNQWVADQKAKGVPAASIKATMKSFDRYDRYDYDGDGNFNEPDGYLDHVQVVHAGGDEADGDPQQGEDAIWSHRWYVAGDQEGQTGPADNKLGGTQVADTGLWVGDYTMQPENGGLSTITHEYGHDLGLPDLYDTATGGEQPMEFWSLMAQSRLSAKNDQGIGTRAGDLGAWEKLQLGWLDYEIGVAGQRRTLDLGPHEYNSAKPQALVTVLPPKTVVTPLPAPKSGTKQWWSGSGDDLTSTLTRSVALPAGNPTLTFWANYDIEEGYDYAQVQVDAGSGFTSLPGGLTTVPETNGIDGSTDNAWVPASYDLSAYAGKTVALRFRYKTDGGVAGNDDDPGNNGFFVDDIAVRAGATTVFSDGAEHGTNGWTADGFSAVGTSTSADFPQYYLASYRSYASYDQYLKTGPYDFGYGPALPDKVDHFPYQDGLQVTYWDGSYADNNVSQHPGNGLILTVDAHPNTLYRLDGAPWRARVQIYDATFGRQKADSVTLHINGTPSYIRGQDAQPLFDDTRSYFRARSPRAGVKVADTGVTLKVLEQDSTSMKVELGTSRPVSASTTLAKARAAS